MVSGSYVAIHVYTMVYGLLMQTNYRGINCLTAYFVCNSQWCPNSYTVNKLRRSWKSSSSVFGYEKGLGKGSKAYLYIPTMEFLSSPPLFPEKESMAALTFVRLMGKTMNAILALRADARLYFYSSDDHKLGHKEHRVKIFRQKSWGTIGSELAWAGGR